MLITKEREAVREVKTNIEAERESVFGCIEIAMNKFPAYKAVTDPYHNIEMTYGELKKTVDAFAGGLQKLGIKKDDHVCLFSENNGRWIVVNLGVLKCGAINVVRGSNAPIEELDFIISHSDSTVLVVQDTTLLKKLAPFINKHNLRFIVSMFNGKNNDKGEIQGLNCPVYSFDDIITLGEKNDFKTVEVGKYDDCAILYTSGTTGNPKGVLLSHNNFLVQIIGAHSGFLSREGENTLQVLPVWHAYEMVGQYYYFSRGCHLHFTTISGLKNDLLKYKIDTMMSVPRIWEAMRTGIYKKLKQNSKPLYYLFDFAIKTSIAYKETSMYVEKRKTNKRKYHLPKTVFYFVLSSILKPLHLLFGKVIYSKIKKAAGINFRALLSGGGALSMQDELFYEAIGVDLRIGYGLTETSPVLTLEDIKDKNFLCSAGSPIKDTEIKIVDPKTGQQMPKYEKGLVMARGPQVMRCYYKDPVATRAVLSEDGWFNTGDLGWLTNENNLVLVGRLKETIVLSNGENVEPAPIEEACLTSPYIDQIVLVGQDKNAVGALVVPSEDALKKCGMDTNALARQKDATVKHNPLRQLIKNELLTNIKNKPNLKVFEKINKFEVLKDAFSIANGLLTSTAKIKRNKVFEKYKEVIAKMYE